MAGALVGIAGLFGTGLCDHFVARAPLAPNLASGSTELEDYKGQPRFVTKSEAQVCVGSRAVAVGGIGIGIVLSLVLYFVFGRLPHERRPPST